jgi:hypothetical protein
LRRHGSDSIYWLIYAALSAVGLYVILLNKYLPMVDLPGHVAQLAMIRRTLGGTPLPPGFVWNAATPYLTGYALAYPLTFLLPTTQAIKIVVATYVAVTPLTVRYLLKTLGAEAWWSLLFFVFVFSHPFYHGFYSYLVATPLGVLTLAISIRAREERTLRWRAATVVLSLLLLVSHVLVFLIVAGMFGAYVLGDWRRGRPPRELLLWVPAGLGFLAWSISFFDSSGQQGRWEWNLGLGRLLQIGSGAAGDARDAAIGWFVFSALLLLGLVSGFRVRPRRGVLAMFAGVAGLSLFCPSVAAGIYHLSWRLSFWFLVGVFALATPMGSGRRAWVARVATIAMLGAAMGWIGARLHDFDREARTFDPVLAAMDSEKLLHPLIFDFRGRAAPSARYVYTYLHFGGWYYVEQRGLYARMFRFAPRHLPIVRTQPLFGETWREDTALWSEAFFDLDKEGEYDYYLLRKESEELARRFMNRHPALLEVTRSGPWYLLRRDATTPPLHLQSSPPDL